MGSFFKLSDSQILETKPIPWPPVCGAGTAASPRPPPRHRWLCAARQTPQHHPAETAGLPTTACSKAHLKQHKNIHWLHSGFGAVPRSTVVSLIAPSLLRIRGNPSVLVPANRHWCCTINNRWDGKVIIPVPSVPQFQFSAGGIIWCCHSVVFMTSPHAAEETWWGFQVYGVLRKFSKGLKIKKAFLV